VPLSHRLGLALVLACVIPSSAWAQDPVIAAAGDIACSPDDVNFNGGEGTGDYCRQKYTSDLLVGAGLTNVLALGDTQYARGTAAEFQGSYDPTWGRVKSITRPVIGNHEYRPDPDTGDITGTGYFDYFNGIGQDNGPAGERGKGYYSFDIGSWHLIALNSMCDHVPGGCGAGSAQEQWLRADLAANDDASCTLAYWHHPQFHSGPNEGPEFDLSAFWQALYDARADLVLNGHTHTYERFAAQDPMGNADPDGLREFIAGTGGRSRQLEHTNIAPNSELRDRTHFGVLKLVLHEGSYDWAFVTETGTTLDSGSGTCHDKTPPETTIDSGPTGTTSATTASFTLSSSEAGSSFQCRLDSGSWAGCGSPAGYGGLASGEHTFEARATDPAGNTDPTPAARTWSVERQAASSERFRALRPTGFEILKGEVYRRRGKLRRLYRNDGRKLEVRAEPRRSGGYRSAVEMSTALGPKQLTTLRSLRLDYNGGTSRRRAAFKVQVFNRRARKWVRVYGPRRGRRDRSFDWSVAAFPDDYLSHRGVLRIRVKAMGRNPFRIRTDLVRLTVEY
jgi:calcineurin-like phosphoesterase family protein